MSIATAFVHELLGGFRHRLHEPPPRTVPAAEDWPEWHHYEPESENER